MSSYWKAHKNVSSLRGFATDHMCECGEPAAEWAYQHTAGDLELRAPDGTHPYSLDPDDYEAMCRGCHRKFDLKTDPGFSRRVGDTLYRNLEKIAERWRSDPEFVEERKDALRRNSENNAERLRSDPEFDKRFRESIKRSWEDSGSERGEKVRGIIQKVNARKRRCAECGQVSNPGGVGRHQKNSGHTGWTDLR